MGKSLGFLFGRPGSLRSPSGYPLYFASLVPLLSLPRPSLGAVSECSAPSGSMSMESRSHPASNRGIPSIWRLTEWWCRKLSYIGGRMGGGSGRSKFGARSPAAHPSFFVFQSAPPFRCLRQEATESPLSHQPATSSRTPCAPTNSTLHC